MAHHADHRASWIDRLPRTDHVDLFRKADYGPTLGAAAGWGPALRCYTSMVFADTRTSVIYWGSDHVAIYNEGAAEVMGEGHPGLMGKSLREGFYRAWEDVRAIFEKVTATGETVDVENITLFLARYGFDEETHFTASFIPLRGDSGEVEGIYNTMTESTSAVLNERRRKVLEDIASMPPYSIDRTLTCSVEALKGNPNDIPLAILYSFDELAAPGALNLRLKDALGLPQCHPCAPTAACLDTDSTGIVPFLRQAAQSNAVTVVKMSRNATIFEGVQWAGYGEPARKIVVVPLTNSGRQLGFYVQGTNPRRPYDDVYQMSIVDLARQIEAKWSSSISIEEAILREELLVNRLTDSERRLRYMAQSAPIGMCQISPDSDGLIKWANDVFYEITGHDRAQPSIPNVLSVILPEDRERASQDVRALLSTDSTVLSDYRLVRKWSPPVKEGDDAVDDTAWICMTGFSVFEEGVLKHAMVYLYDISRQKWAESVQSQNAADANLAKRRQEEFIDITSHEMRNPLQAIVQLADGISRSVQPDTSATLFSYETIAKQNTESAGTILACAAHLQRVINDILVLSRLESEMLTITPVVSRIPNVLSDTKKMFDGEVAIHGTNIEIVREESYDSLAVDQVLCDTSRLAQILINLISNAIKFMSSRQERTISISYGAGHKRPLALQTPFGELEWMQSRNEQHGNKMLPALEPGEQPLYLHFCVRDTGPGVKPNEIKKLFQRFSQANERTHITHGGSGLGLYICRELAETQGGAVGIVSRLDAGSIFGFYIETRHAESSKDKQNTMTDENALPTRSRTLQQNPRHPQTQDHTQASGQANEKGTGNTGLVAAAGSQPSKWNVLLVEDNLINQKVLARQLRNANCVVTTANHGQEALDIIEKTKQWRQALGSAGDNDQPAGRSMDVALMDWEMPVMSGLECCKRIRAFELTHKIPSRLPIIAITANVRQAQISDALEAGMNSVMPKPFTVADLLERIRETVEEAKGRSS